MVYPVYTVYPVYPVETPTKWINLATGKTVETVKTKVERAMGFEPPAVGRRDPSEFWIRGAPSGI